jgi:hypothetical protein
MSGREAEAKQGIQTIYRLPASSIALQSNTRSLQGHRAYDCTVKPGFWTIYIVHRRNSVCLPADTPASAGPRLGRAVDF